MTIVRTIGVTYDDSVVELGRDYRVTPAVIVSAW